MRELELTRKDRIGVVVLSFLVILSIYLPSLLHRAFEKPYPDEDTAWIAAFRELESTTEDEEIEENSPRGLKNRGFQPFSAKEPGLNPFHFDPNSLPRAGWRQLGLPERTISTILNYLEKGGKFRTKEDLKKIYGIRPEQYDILEDYIRIGSDGEVYAKKEKLTFPSQGARLYQAVDLNSADTVALIALPGIGSKLASRIIAFREKLGGFYDVEQVREVYGLADSAFQKCRQYMYVDLSELSKININDVSLEELKKHPYLRTLAPAIISYRHEHGAFASVEELQKIFLINEAVLKKIAPYLRTE